jgi:hypothetical protein
MITRRLAGIFPVLEETASSVVFNGKGISIKPGISDVVKYGQNKYAVINSFTKDNMYRAIRVPETFYSSLGIQAEEMSLLEEEMDPVIVRKSVNIFRLPSYSLLATSEFVPDFKFGVPAVDSLIDRFPIGSKVGVIGSPSILRMCRNRIIQSHQNNTVLCSAESSISPIDQVYKFLSAINDSSSDKLLILSDLGEFKNAFAQLERIDSIKFPFTFESALSSLLKNKTSQSAVIFAESAEAHQHALGISADFLLEIDNQGNFSWESILRVYDQLKWRGMKGKINLCREVMADEISTKLRQGLQLKQEISQKLQFGIHVDFWEEEEIDDFQSFCKEIRQHGGLLLHERTALLDLPRQPFSTNLMSLAGMAEECQDLPRLLELFTLIDDELRGIGIHKVVE